MRITNAFGGFLTLIVALGLNYMILLPTFAWIDNQFAGEVEVLAMMGLFIFAFFITLVLPIIIATEDTSEG